MLISTSGGVRLYIRVNGRTPRRFVSILILSALAYTDSVMELNRILFSCLERKCGRCELQRVLDHHFNVCLGVCCREMELTRTWCFEFNWMLRADSKHVLLSTFCFYFMVAGFTYWSLHPVVDKGLGYL